jgi:LPXTG-motif cell wall-anchored protein
MRRTSVLVGLAAVASAALTFIAPAASAYPPSGSTITLTSYAVHLLDTDTAQGTGFDPGEGVNGDVHSTPVFVGHTTANANGVARLTFTVPASLAAGTHTFTFVGQRSGHTLSTTFTVLGGGAARSSSGSGLPFTGGNDIWPMTAAGVGLVLAGGLALVVVRRRRSHAGLAA